MASFSIDKAIKTCKVTVDNAQRLASDRFLNSNSLSCIVWNGRDNLGRQVCSDSFNTKVAGCNSAQDMVLKENFLRPQYSAYINLNPGGISGDMYADSQYCSTRNWLDSRDMYTGNFGSDLGAHMYPSCSMRELQAVDQAANAAAVHAADLRYAAGNGNMMVANLPSASAPVSGPNQAIHRSGNSRSSVARVNALKKAQSARQTRARRAVNTRKKIAARR